MTGWTLKEVASGPDWPLKYEVRSESGALLATMVVMGEVNSGTALRTIGAAYQLRKACERAAKELEHAAACAVRQPGGLERDCNCAKQAIAEALWDAEYRKPDPER